MPKTTNPKGIAIINRGFITLSFFRLLIAFGYWKREAGQNREYVLCQTGAEVHATVECVARSSTSCAPLQLSKMLIDLAFLLGINVARPERDCCKIVDSFEKELSRKKDVFVLGEDVTRYHPSS